MKKTLLYVFIFSIIILIIYLSLKPVQASLSETPIQKIKQKGAHVFGIQTESDLERIAHNNLDWITLVSWAYQKDYNSSELNNHNGDSVRIKEHNQHWIENIKLIKCAGYKVFMKPHVWISHPSNGNWRSDIFPENETNWKIWKKNYTEFILRYAQISETAKADMFCLGTEFSRLTVEKPEFWKELIEKVKKVYSGKLCYAANWYKEYKEITFWDQLDFIGIQAYFPLVENEFPTSEQISVGWDKYIPVMDSISAVNNRQILFTEMGYKSTSGSAIKPWLWSEDPKHNDIISSPETQTNSYKAFFNSIWNKEWFAGVHLWQFRANYKPENLGKNNNFTPQGKPAEQIISNTFKEK